MCFKVIIDTVKSAVNAICWKIYDFAQQFLGCRYVRAFTPCCFEVVCTFSLETIGRKFRVKSDESQVMYRDSYYRATFSFLCTPGLVISPPPPLPPLCILSEISVCNSSWVMEDSLSLKIFSLLGATIPAI